MSTHKVVFLFILSLPLLLGGCRPGKYHKKTFTSIVSLLESELNSNQERVEDIIIDIKRKANRRRNDQESIEVIQSTQTFRSKSEKLIIYIDFIKKRMRTEQDMIDENRWTGIFYNATSSVVPGILQHYLSEYKKYVQEGFSEYFDPVNSPIKWDEHFVERHLRATSVEAALALLTQMQVSISHLEIDIISKMPALIPRLEPLCDNVVVDSGVLSEVVTQGDSLKMELFIGQIVSEYPVQMTLNDNPIEVVEGIGTVRIKAETPGEKSFRGAVSFKVNKRDTTLSFLQRYTVVKPFSRK